MTLGSLFDGSGGFPLAGMLSGIKTVWLSEIEPFPLMVTDTRFPEIKQYGDVNKLNGAELEPVDIISFGSPCQDLSNAGLRAGLEGQKSNLFFQAIRIIKEMRYATNGAFPRFAVWENVAGAFSSNRGKDFRTVLQAFVSVKDTDTIIPMPFKDNWFNAGSIVGDDYSLCWRKLDAQFWGVPQHRERIFLVADFASGSSGTILFERGCVPKHFAEVYNSWQRFASLGETGIRDTGRQDNGADESGDGKDLTYAVSCYRNHSHGGDYDEMKVSSSCNCHHEPHALVYENHNLDGRVTLTESSPSLRAEDSHKPLVFEQHSQDARYKDCGNTAPTVTQFYGTGGMNKPLCIKGHSTTSKDPVGKENKSFVLASAQQLYSLGTDILQAGLNTTGHNVSEPKENGNAFGLTAKHIGGVGSSKGVRVFTPQECARLQGFPSWWCDGLAVDEPTQEQVEKWTAVWAEWNEINGKKPKTEKQVIKWLQKPHSDTAEYKMWGNGIALPCALFVVDRIKANEK